MPLTIGELRAAASFLNQARVLIEGVKDLFLGRDTDAAARLGDIRQRIDDEREYVERLITKPTNGGGQKP
jgi:hypothetical protein